MNKLNTTNLLNFEKEKSDPWFNDDDNHMHIRN